MPERLTAMSRITRLAIGPLAAASMVAACGDSDPSSAGTAHPALECEDESSGTGNYDVIGPGLETPEAALDERLGYYRGLYGGEIVELTNSEAALRVDGSNVVVAIATATAEGGFLVQEDYFCNGFQPQQKGPPATESPVTPESAPAEVSTVTTAPRPDGTSGLTVSAPIDVSSAQDEVGVGEVRLWVSNQSFEDDPVFITIRIDGEPVVNDSFAVEGQHNWMSFDIAGLSSGSHEVVAVSDTGAQTGGSFTLPEGESRWLVVDYWYDAGEPDNRYFTLSESDVPVGFD